ncbi:MAG: sugar phosphate isomerase/epimerase [Armatimonadetes bacterium]|nr:sugar phosphate isomerase/epimerase [Armatimonadota bacterium]
MRLVTSLNVLYDYTTEIDRAVSRLAAAGFDAIDFNGCDMMKPWRGPLGDDCLNQLQAAGQRHGLPFTQAHGPMFNYWGEQAAEDLADTFRCLEWCGQLGIPWMVMHPGTITGGYGPAHREQTLEANLAFFRQFVPVMETHGVGIAIENMADGFRAGRMYGAVPAELVELCDALDHELFGLCWDTGHAFLQGLPQREAIGSLGQRLKVIHVQDNDGKMDHHLLPYHGKIDWQTVVDGLKEAGYRGNWTYEVHAAVRFYPDELRDAALKLATAIGRHFLARLTPAPV